jgi:hypothetical protein
MRPSEFELVKTSATSCMFCNSRCFASTEELASVRLHYLPRHDNSLTFFVVILLNADFAFLHQFLSSSFLEARGCEVL